jgi:hypothetical protein
VSLGRVRTVEAAFLKTLKHPEFVAEAESANDLEPDPWDRPAQHDRRRPCPCPQRSKKKLKPTLAPKGWRESRSAFRKPQSLVINVEGRKIEHWAGFYDYLC